MRKPNCPICDAKIVSRCPCIKGSSICENKHSFHYAIRMIKLNVYEIEVHNGLGDHFSDVCKECAVIGKYVEER